MTSRSRETTVLMGPTSQLLPWPLRLVMLHECTPLSAAFQGM